MDYRNQFVLTGELNDIGEMIASNDNSGKSYRMGVELEAAWQPVNWFRWDANATWSRNRAKDWTVTIDDSPVNLGDTPLSFSPEILFNNLFTFNYKAFTASVQSQYVGEQYLTNTGFKDYLTQDDNGKDVRVSMMLDDYFTTNLNLAYRLKLPKMGIKEATVGVTLYNLFSAKYDNNGWASPKFKKDAAGKVIAYNNHDRYEAGFAPSAPFNWMAHLSISF
jgi:iron complex outermembrane receptor protein